MFFSATITAFQWGLQESSGVPLHPFWLPSLLTLSPMSAVVTMTCRHLQQASSPSPLLCVPPLVTSAESFCHWLILIFTLRVCHALLGSGQRDHTNDFFWDAVVVIFITAILTQFSSKRENKVNLTLKLVWCGVCQGPRAIIYCLLSSTHTCIRTSVFVHLCLPLISVL